MSGEPEKGRGRLRVPVESFRGRLFVGTIAGLMVAACVAIAFVFSGLGWFDAAILGALFGLPVFFSVIRWETAASICLSLLETVAMILAVLGAALAAIFGAFAG